MTVAGSRRRANHRGQPDLADCGELGIPVTRREAGSMWDSRFEIRDSRFGIRDLRFGIRDSVGSVVEIGTCSSRREGQSVVKSRRDTLLTT